MQEAIQHAIEHQAKKLLERQKRKKFSLTKYRRRFKLRTGVEAKISARDDKLPDIWGIHKHFDPIYCLKHSKFLAKSIWTKIQLREYQVTPALNYKIPKDDGTFREIMVFTIPDAAVANLFNRKLRDRNKNLQSPFCYSYRKDRTIFDAVLQTKSLLDSEKVFIVQYDFSKYFDSIHHDYINFILESDSFFLSPAEKYIIQKFLTHQYAETKDYKIKNYNTRLRGVPQGCSLSLFLSNIACHELDKKLEKSNGMFVRFADDIVCVANEYDDALNIVESFKSHCHYSGISINFSKSDGIQLMEGTCPNDSRQMFIDHADIGKLDTIREFDYIGHKFSRDYVLMSGKAIKRIKSRISRIIYAHLIRNLKAGLFSEKRIGNTFYDWDLVTCLNEIRRYIYGGLTEDQLNSFLFKNERISRFKGLMGFYPLVTKVYQFRELDGWILSVLKRALTERAKLIKSLSPVDYKVLTDKQILNGSWYQFSENIVLETKAPSFVLAWRAARKAFRQYGLSDFEAPKYYSSAFLEYDNFS